MYLVIMLLTHALSCRLFAVSLLFVACSTVRSVTGLLFTFPLSMSCLLAIRVARLLGWGACDGVLCVVMSMCLWSCMLCVMYAVH